VAVLKNRHIKFAIINMIFYNALLFGLGDIFVCVCVCVVDIMKCEVL